MKRTIQISALTACLALLSLVVPPPSAWAKGKVFLNGKRIKSLYNQKFRNVQVTFDAKGNIYMKIPHMKVKKAKLKGNKVTLKAARAKKKKPRLPRLKPRPKHQYFLVIRRDRPKASGYRFRIHINGRRVFQEGPSTKRKRVVLRATPFLKKGRNQVTIHATKRSMSKGRVKIFLARGVTRDKALVTTEPMLFRYKRTGKERRNYRHIIPVTIQ